jgi:hypothetical protein
VKSMRGRRGRPSAVFRLLTLGTLLCLSFIARQVWACACCDGQSKVTPLGWSAEGELLVRHEEFRGCEPKKKLEVYAVEHTAPTTCYDLLGDPNRRVPCSKVVSDWEKKEKPSSALASFADEPTSVSALSLSARYTVTPDGAFRKAALEIFLNGSTGAPLLRLSTHEYEYQSPDGAEPVVFPLEVTVLPAPTSPRKAFVIVRGMDDNPGIGHRAFVTRWVSLPPDATTVPGVAWVRAIPRYGSPNAEAAPRAASRENGAGLAALKAGKPAAAREHFEKAVVAEPSHVFARYNLACALSLEGALVPALEQLTELLTRAPEPVRKERRERAQVDPDLLALREHPAFQTLVCGGRCQELPAVNTLGAPSALTNAPSSGSPLGSQPNESSTVDVPSSPTSKLESTSAPQAKEGSCGLGPHVAPRPFWIVAAMFLALVCGLRLGHRHSTSTHHSARHPLS